MTHADIVQKFANLRIKDKQSIKWGPNTVIHIRDGFFAVKLYDTDILLFYPNGDVIINMGGYNTKLTKNRINDCLPPGWSVFSDKGELFLHTQRKGIVWPFEDGITIHGDGSVSKFGRSNNVDLNIDCYLRVRLSKLKWKK